MKRFLQLIRFLSLFYAKMKNLYNLIVDKISMVSNKETPAVQKAHSGFFSVLKIKQGRNQEQIERLEKIKKLYQKDKKTE